MGQMSSSEKKLDLELTNMKRNPYLVDYAEYKQGREHRAVRSVQKSTGAAARAKTVKAQKTGTRTKALVYSGTVETAGGAFAAGRATAASNRARIADRRRKALFYRRLVLGAGITLAVVLALLLGIQTWQKARQGAEAANSGVGQNEANNLFFDDLADKTVQGLSAKVFGKHPTWTEDFLTVNEYSRPGDELKEVNSIFVHYTANPGTSAAQNRSYFEQLKDTHERSASAHFIIGYDGEILQCIPLDEIAYAVQTRNEDSISIECCYLEKDGSFTQETYDSLILLLGWLREAYGLEKEDILRHYDCGGKKCPLYYTEHADAWEQLKRDVK